MILMGGRRCWAQKGDYFIQNFLPNHYLAAANNFGVTQNNDGLIFVANNVGVLIFDGINWVRCSRADEITITAIGRTASGQIVAGTSDGDIALISKNSKGKYQFKSLIDSLPLEQRPAEAIRQILNVNAKTYFLSADKLIEFDDKRLKAFSSSSSFNARAMVMGQHIFVTEIGQHISVLLHDKLVPLPETEPISGEKHFFCYQIKTNAYAVGYRNIGIYTAAYDSLDPVKTEFKKTQSNCDSELLAAEINNGCRLLNGNCIVTTNKNGAFELDTSLKIVRRFNFRNGIYDDNIKSAFQDNNGNLWLALYYGISFVEINSTVLQYNRTNGITGLIQSAAFYDEKLFIATDKGVQYYDSTDEKFKTLEDFNKQTWCLLPVEENLFVGTVKGLFVRTAGQMKQLNEENTFCLIRDTYRKGLLYAGTENGVHIFKMGRLGLTLLKTINFNNPVKNIATDYTGNIYFNTADRHIYYLNRRKEFQLDSVDGMADLPIEYFENYIFTYKQKLMLGSYKGIYSLKEVSKNRIKCFKDDTFWPPTQGSQIFRATQIGDNIVCSQIYLDSLKNNTEVKITLLEVNSETKKVASYPINHLKNVIPNSFTYDSLRKILLISANEGLFLISDKLIDRKRNFNFFLNKLTNNTDTLLENLTANEISDSLSLTIPYQNNDLAAVLGFNSFELTNVEFTYKLEGTDTEFHKWTNDNKITLTNLREGKYVLHLKARTPQDGKEYEIRLPFRILPPWYRSIYMYVVYGILFIAFVYLMVRLNTQRLTRLNKKLENTIEERTSTISIQKQELEHKQKEILDSINYAQRIQHSLLASDRFLKSHLPEYFVFFQPKDVVSGDFYWAAVLQDGCFALVTADSTGHGVPGAIMSMLNISCLKEAVEAEKLTAPADILNHTRKKVIETLANDGSAEGGKDGMDCSLLCIDFASGKLKYAAANNPVWVVRKINNELAKPGDLQTEFIELRPDKMPVGKHDKDMVSFSQHSFEFQEDDMIYTLTDGLPDQFGGPNGKKFMYKKLKDILISISQLPLHVQKTMIEQHLKEWRGNLEQVDDITLIGFRVKSQS